MDQNQANERGPATRIQRPLARIPPDIPSAVYDTATSDKIERSESGVCGAGLNRNMYGKRRRRTDVRRTR